MKLQHGLLLPGLLVLVALIFAAGKPVPVAKKISVDASAEALQNPLLALGRYAQSLGADVAFHRQLPADSLPPARNGLLWLPVPGKLLGDAPSRALIAWVEAGGTLVLAPDIPEHWIGDALLQAADIHFATHSDEQLADIFGEEPPWQTLSRHGMPYTLDGESVLRAWPDRYHHVTSGHDNARGLLCDPGGCRALRVALGKGAILALADASIFSNASLDAYDHAAIARALFGLRAGQHAWIIYEERVPTLMALLWQHAPALLISALFAILLWLFAISDRFGPALPSPEAARRRLAEHIEASGLLLERHGAGARLWRAVHDDFQRTLLRRHPQGADEAELIALLARHTGIAEDDVRAAITAKPEAENPAAQPTAFASAIRRLETLRKKL